MAEDEETKTIDRFGRPPELRADADGFVVDEVSKGMYPSEAPRGLLPVQVYEDGNCLFRSASVLLYGRQE